MAQLTEAVSTLMEHLARFPGIGRKSAERLTYHLLRILVKAQRMQSKLINFIQKLATAQILHKIIK